MKLAQGQPPQQQQQLPSPPSWDAELARLCAEITPLKRRPALIDAARELPRIVNVVATASLLPPGYTLPLKLIARSVGCAQYAPRMFAATILKFTDSISSCTALVFSTGCIVVVSLRSKNHARYICQMLRIILEQVRCAAVRRADGTLMACGSFAGCLRFERCEIHNIVGNADLGYRIDLRAMADAAPACCKWFPELFPGLECKIWLTESYACVCGRAGVAPSSDRQRATIAGTQRKCSCVVKLLIFDTGRLVITGARRLEDVNAVYFRIKALVSEFRSGGATAEEGISSRSFYNQFGSMLAATAPKPGAAAGANGEKPQRRELKPDVAVACVLSGVNPMAAAATAAAAASGVHKGSASDPPFMQMALAGRIETVRTFYLMDSGAADERDAQGRTTLERLRAIPAGQRTTEQRTIEEMLAEVKLE